MSKKNTRRQKRKKNKLTNKKKKVNNMKKTTVTSTWKKPVTPPCHTGQNKIFTTTSGIDVYGGGRNRNGGWWNMNTMPELAIGPSETMSSFKASSATDVPDGWSCDAYTNKVTPPPLINMDFPDFGVPQVQDLFWYALCDDIHEHGIKSVSTQCAGGHGRTGVQLCILYYLLNDDDVRATIRDAAQLIELIRDLHCHHAVETNEQQKYIARVLDIPAGDSVIVDRYGGHSFGGWSGKATVTPTVDIGSKYGPLDLEYDPSEEWGMIGLDSDIEIENKCDCCGDDNMDGDECITCGWVMPSTSDSEDLCLTCGVTHTESCFLLPGSECIFCEADTLKVKSSNAQVQCHACKRMRYPDMILRSTKDGFICRACEVVS